VLTLDVLLGGLAWLALQNPRRGPMAFGAAACAVAVVYILMERRYPMGTAEAAGTR
jgi:hypothetical protein